MADPGGTAIWTPSREELLEIALHDLARPIPSTKGMDPQLADAWCGR